MTKYLTIVLLISSVVCPLMSYAGDPYGEGRVRKFNCPKGSVPYDSDGDGYPDICVKIKNK